MKRTMLLVLTLALALPTTLMMALYPASPASAATDNLPDLRMAHLQDFRTVQSSDGRRLLRFSSIVVNTGDGRFEANGERPSRSADTMSVRQRIYNAAGGYRGRPTAAKMFFSGDGHNHWHVEELEDFTLTRLDNGRKVGTGAKHGFCFYDNYRFGSTLPPRYTIAGGACGVSSDLRVRMGLAVGWGDIYRYNLPGQYIDVTELTPGQYRLRAVADRSNWFVEKNNRNNHTWVDLRISGNGVSVVKQGPGAR